MLGWMDVGYGSHGLSAKGTKDEVKRPKSLQLEVGEGPPNFQ